VFHEFSSSVIGRWGFAAWCRKAVAMLVATARRCRLMAMLRKVVIT
jgi:hypothetical protein